MGTSPGSIPGGPKKRYPGINFAITSANVNRFYPFFTVTTRNVRRIKVKLRPLPHLYSVTPIPSKTHTTANIDATFSNV